MKIRQLRNATILLTLGEHCLLIDPMFCKPGSIPGLRFFRGKRRPNPLVAMPSGMESHLAEATGVLLTHEHPDHFDVPAIRWIQKRDLPVWASSIDAPGLAKKGIRARDICDDEDFGIPVEVIPTRHGRGILGWLMGPVSGFYLAHPDEPSIYIVGDSVLTESVIEAVNRLQPDVIVVPAGSANFGVGSDILFSVDELVTLVQQSSGAFVFNHLEALDHCPTTRLGLRERMDVEGVGARVHIPADGELLEFSSTSDGPHVPPKAPTQPKPGFQKWLTAKFSGT